MTDHRDPSTPSDPDARQAVTLAQLDRIGRRAASALLTAIDAPPALPTAPATPAAERSPRPRGRRAWLAAAAAVLVLVAGAVVVRGAADDRAEFSSGGVTYLVAGWVPEGWAPRWPYYDGIFDGAGDLEGDMAVYGDGRVEDPWSGPPMLAIVHTDGEPHGFPDMPQGEPITVAGDEGVLAYVEGAWIATTGELTVTGDDTTRDQVVEAAAHATDQPAIGEAGLPAGFREIARGDTGGTGNVEAVERGVNVQYGEEGVTATDVTPDPDGLDEITVLQRPGVPSAVDLIRVPHDGARYTTVRGQRAVMKTGRTSLQVGDEPEIWLPTVTLQWLEPSGTLVKVTSTGVPQEDVLRFVEALRPAGDAEAQELVSTYGVEHGIPVDPDARAGLEESGTTYPPTPAD